MMRLVVIAAALVVTSCGGSGAASAPTPEQSHEVVYAADGVETKTASYTLQSDDGGTVQGDIDLPLTSEAGDVGLRFGGFRSGDFVYLSVQNSEGFGSVTCRIVVDGIEVSSNTSTGGYVIATCKGTVP